MCGYAVVLFLFLFFFCFVSLFFVVVVLVDDFLFCFVLFFLQKRTSVRIPVCLPRRQSPSKVSVDLKERFRFMGINTFL